MRKKFKKKENYNADNSIDDVFMLYIHVIIAISPVPRLLMAEIAFAHRRYVHYIDDLRKYDA